MTRLVYDETFEGLLTALFQVYDERLQQVAIVPVSAFQPDFFAEDIKVFTDASKADRVWQGLKPFSHLQQLIYRSYLREASGAENKILEAVRYVLKTKNEKDYGHPAVLQLADWTKEVGREKHRMEAFVRFKRAKDNTYLAVIEPDFNVLPLIAKHFKNRYADQVFMIYDLKRDYGIYYDLKKVDFVNLEAVNLKNLNAITHEEEIFYDQMWQDYFKSTGIKSRINKKLHLRHVPRRYWKYLNEKNPH
ncbi:MULTISPECIES: TIGR03915 family putative DNA repair protein [unclassified Leeuwenhoekiella]|uniref:TIGR03915 family putative DNA repair protein n=1 Tax=unclassified Leeuwenhoekiella TaxID=2615029 RepID=UPI000C5FDEE8|nr:MULTISPECIES: TIGR03915 family putative DNA repair protein [unclassified Leeuwenhoekiella]MBA82566.1 DNA metabolism protein [Leeuwenhoekiella sp.]|tara:strand:- start:48622 stop:49365 length:744 start_codon:yes stop_codon:yes gene_type:complete